MLVVLLCLVPLFLGSIESWWRSPSHSLHLTPNVLNFLTLYLAASGILYAIFHEIGLDKSVRKLRAIEGSLSTRPVGPFPHHLEEIGKLLDGASRLTILADCADYGSFFAPDKHEMLHDAISRFSKAEGHETRILVAGPPAPITATRGWSQYDYVQRSSVIMKGYWTNYIKTVRADTPFLAWLGGLTDGSGSDPDPTFQLFTRWVSRHSSEVPERLRDVLIHAKSICDGKEPLEANIASAEAFLWLLQARQYWFERTLYAARADIRHVQQPTSLFFWISRRTCEPIEAEEDGIALFSFPSPRTDGRGALAFRTIDPDLIKTFEGIFEKLWPPKVNEKSGHPRT
jgi:hypothetical protein